MRSALFVLLIGLGASVAAQTIKVSPTELAFLQSTTIVNFRVDLSKTTMGSFSSINEWVNFRYNELKLKENESEAKEWKADWEQALKDGLGEFRDDFSAHMENSGRD